VVAGYKQMRGGIEANILNEVDEKSFDRAFSIIRPVIQGTGDIGVDEKSKGDAKLSEEEIRASMDFIFRLFVHPPTPDGGHAHGNVADLDEDARNRLYEFEHSIPHMVDYDGVKLVLDEATEKMRLSVIGGTATKLKPIPTTA
jgi:hypothetical protein